MVMDNQVQTMRAKTPVLNWRSNLLMQIRSKTAPTEAEVSQSETATQMLKL